MPLIRAFIPKVNVERDRTLRRILARLEQGGDSDAAIIALANYLGNQVTFEVLSTTTSS